MLPYLLRRLFNAALIFLGLSLLVYLLIYLSPADPAQVIAAQRLGGPASSEVLAQVREEYGLDQPVPMQYLRWLGQAVQGDFGYSIRTGNLVASEMACSDWFLGAAGRGGNGAGLIDRRHLWDLGSVEAGIPSRTMPFDLPGLFGSPFPTSGSRSC